MHNPKLLFLDEPTTGLDPTSRADFWATIKNLRSNGVTIFLTTHYLDEADSLCDTICIMVHGSVAAQGTSPELKRLVAGDVIKIGMSPEYYDKAKMLLQPRGDIREIQTTEKALKLYVEAGEKALPEILPLFVEASIPVTSIEMSRPSLEEVFLNITGHTLENPTEMRLDQ